LATRDKDEICPVTHLNIRVLGRLCRPDYDSMKLRHGQQGGQLI
jgi:hypothetical protein